MNLIPKALRHLVQVMPDVNQDISNIHVLFSAYMYLLRLSKNPKSMILRLITI